MRVTALVFCLAAMLAFTSSASADRVDWSDFIETRPAKQQPKAAPAPTKVARTQTARPQPKRAAQPAKAVAKKKTLPKPRRR